MLLFLSVRHWEFVGVRSEEVDLTTFKLRLRLMERLELSLLSMYLIWTLKAYKFVAINKMER